MVFWRQHWNSSGQPWKNIFYKHSKTSTLQYRSKYNVMLKDNFHFIQFHIILYERFPLHTFFKYKINIVEFDLFKKTITQKGICLGRKQSYS